MHNLIEKVGLHGKMLFVLRDKDSGQEKQCYEINNVICDRGKAVIAARLNSESTYSGMINYLAVGTGTSTPLSTDTQLQTELARTTVSTSSRSNNIATINFFFGSSSANGTLTEAGGFIDGTALANSGQIFDRVSLPSIVKTSADTLTVTLIATVS